MNTNRWMQEVNARFPVRKSKVQKAQFRQYVLQKAQEMGYAARMEENKAICTNRNIVVGDVDKAKVLVTAHYDTPATVGLPNVMLPMNRPMFYLVQALIALVMVVFIFVPTGIVEKLTGSIFCTEATLIGLYCLMMYLLLAGVPNPHNVNDNTSGVCGVLALMESFAAEKPEEIAFVLFDNEEKGLLGASGLAKAHKAGGKRDACAEHGLHRRGGSHADACAESGAGEVSGTGRDGAEKQRHSGRPWQHGEVQFLLRPEALQARRGHLCLPQEKACRLVLQQNSYQT